MPLARVSASPSFPMNSGCCSQISRLSKLELFSVVRFIVALGFLRKTLRALSESVFEASVPQWGNLSGVECRLLLSLYILIQRRPLRDVAASSWISPFPSHRSPMKSSNSLNLVSGIAAIWKPGMENVMWVWFYFYFWILSVVYVYSVSLQDHCLIFPVEVIWSILHLGVSVNPFFNPLFNLYYSLFILLLFFVYPLFILCLFFIFILFILCSFFVHSLLILSLFVCLIFVHSLFILCLFFVYIFVYSLFRSSLFFVYSFSEYSTLVYKVSTLRRLLPHISLIHISLVSFL